MDYFELQHYVALHSAEDETWFVNAKHINAIRSNHGKPDSRDDGTWVYLTGDSIPIRVKETPEELLKLLNFEA